MQASIEFKLVLIRFLSARQKSAKICIGTHNELPGLGAADRTAINCKYPRGFRTNGEEIEIKTSKAEKKPKNSDKVPEAFPLNVVKKCAEIHRFKKLIVMFRWCFSRLARVSTT